MSNSAVAELTDLVFRGGCSGLEPDPSENGLAEFRVRKAHHGDVGDFGMCEQKLFNLARKDVFAAANQHFLGAAGDFEVSIRKHDAEVAGVQPVFRIDGACSSCGLAIVALHDQIAPRANLALL